MVCKSRIFRKFAGYFYRMKLFKQIIRAVIVTLLLLVVVLPVSVYVVVSTPWA